MSLVHTETPFGTKMSVHQGSCNLDKTCIKGECPSFVIARLRPGRAAAKPRAYPSPPASLPEPVARPWSGSTVIRMPGIGGTGVVTASRIVQMAAHLGGLHAAGIDQTGLAQKGGPVTSDVRISDTPITGDVHASRHGADLLLGFDLLGAAGDEALRITSSERTVAVLNTAEVPTASMLRHQEAAYPLEAGLQARIGRSTRADEMVCIDAQRIAEVLTGDHQAANLVLIGAAFQAGHLPIGTDELTEAVRLNGVDVEASLAAIAWGRASVAAPGLVAAALAPPEDSPAPSHPAAPVPAGLQPNALWPESLRDVVALRVAELIAFQSKRVARRYLTRVTAIAERERQATGDPLLPVTETFARGLFALTAIKDEYEVARLHLLQEEQEAFASAFPGARKVYLLKPPLLTTFGLHRKIKLIRSARPAFGLLRAARHLRGTPFDVFGWSAEHRAERLLAEEYRRTVDTAMAALTPSSAGAVLEVVDMANRIHGYAHVRAASIARVRAQAEQQLTELTSPAREAEGKYRVAG
jgi:indolepyruvate ferredoxin oxidoreductase